MCDYGSVVFDLHLTRSACNRSRAAVSEWIRAQNHMLKATDLLLPSISQQIKRLLSARSYSVFSTSSDPLVSLKHDTGYSAHKQSEPQTQSEQEVMYKQKTARGNIFFYKQSKNKKEQEVIKKGKNYYLFFFI